jgi:2-iminobutanoate/2-iminopropanoate deaminase
MAVITFCYGEITPGDVATTMYPSTSEIPGRLRENFMLERLQVAGAPAPQGPYSSVVRAGDFLYVSGQGPVDPISGEIDPETTIRDQTRLVLQNLQTILRGCGADLQDVVKCSVFLQDVKEFELMNEVYGEVFGAYKPARTTVGAGMVALGMKVEIDCVAYLPKPA